MSTYTHGHHESVLRAHRWRTAANSAAYLLPLLRPEHRLLDVGCGPATITADLANLVASVTALEATENAVNIARQGLAGVTNAEVVLGDVHTLELPDESFDVVHAHQVLQHVADPVQALREMARVCKPGGLVAVRDSDYRGFTWFPALTGLDVWMDKYQQAATANGGEPQAGRRLLSWALEAGLTDVVPSSSTWCFGTEADRAWWGGMWADRIQQSALRDQLLGSGLASQKELDLIEAAWRTFMARPDAWFSVLHGELIARIH